MFDNENYQSEANSGIFAQDPPDEIRSGTIDTARGLGREIVGSKPFHPVSAALMARPCKIAISSARG
jgi:hypothetical protein